MRAQRAPETDEPFTRSSHLAVNIDDVDDQQRRSWLYRRAAFGMAPGEEQPASSAELLNRLVDPHAAGVAPAPETWDDAVLAAAEPSRAQRVHAIDGWLERMRTTPRPLEERMAWVWHDHFATSLDKVRRPALLVAQVRTLQRHGLGSFRELLRALTVDGAMLMWLDGDRSTAKAPNENHGRELLELFAVGLGAHTEADVRAAAVALTGWVVDRRTGQVSFRPRRHDDRPQSMLGRSVHDADTVVDAACTSPACAPFVTRALAGHLLGPAAAHDDELVGDLAASFRSDDLAIRPLVRRLLEAGLARAGESDADAVVEGPVPWLVRAERALGVRLPAGVRLRGLTAAGQVPMRPPDVGGWPGPTAWLSSATVLARSSLAGAMAALVPATSPARMAADAGDLAALATALGRSSEFATSTKTAARELGRGLDLLAFVLAAPDSVVV